MTKWKRYSLLFPLVLTLSCLSQNKPASGQTPARTSGACSPVITGSGNTISIKTCGMTQKQLSAFRELLQGIINNQRIDTDTIVKKLNLCLQSMTDRHLTKSQKDGIASAITGFRGHRIHIISPSDSMEAKNYALEFVELFNRAGWADWQESAQSSSPVGLTLTFYPTDPVGVQVSVNADRPEEVPQDAIMLMDTFYTLGVVNERTFTTDRKLPPGKIELLIGVKPRLF